MPKARISVTLMALALALGASGCGSMPEYGPSLGQTLPHWAGGEPADMPAAPAGVGPFPAVHDMPPSRPTKLITVDEQNKLESELTTLRTQITTQAATLEQQRSAEQAATQDLAARGSAVQQRAEQLRQQSKAEAAARKKLETVARSRSRGQKSGPAASSDSAASTDSQASNTQAQN